MGRLYGFFPVRSRAGKIVSMYLLGVSFKIKKLLARGRGRKLNTSLIKGLALKNEMKNKYQPSFN